MHPARCAARRAPAVCALIAVARSPRWLPQMPSRSPAGEGARAAVRRVLQRREARATPPPPMQTNFPLPINPCGNMLSGIYMARLMAQQPRPPPLPHRPPLICCSDADPTTAALCCMLQPPFLLLSLPFCPLPLARSSLCLACLASGVYIQALCIRAKPGQLWSKPTGIFSIAGPSGGGW